MIKQTQDTQDFFTICDKLKEVKNCRLDNNKLFTHMGCNPNVFTYVSYKDETMNGCAVMLQTIDILGDLVFFVLFQWRDSHFPKLQKEFVQFASEKAKELKLSKVIFTSSRRVDTIKRAVSKYGFHKAYDVWEKEVK